MVVNILTFDVEEGFDVSRCAARQASTFGSRIDITINKILPILKQRGIKATFFVLASAVENNPQIIKDISADGHEIAAHGHLHKPISEQTPGEFKNDLLRSIDILSSITGKQISGFSAPGYSITARTLWALDIIEKAGLKYDFSIYPASIRLFTKGGAPGYPRRPFYIKKNLVEFPLVTLDVFGLRLPVATTAYFRIYPYCITSLAIKRFNKMGIPATVNFHSWKFDEFHPRAPMPFPYNIKHYYNLGKTQERFTRLVADFAFTACKYKLNDVYRHA